MIDRQKDMKSQVADRKKFFAGWTIVALATAVGVYCYVRDHQEGLWLAPLVAFFGWGFAREAEEKKEEPPDIPGLRWYHVVAITGLMVAAVTFLYVSVVR